MLTLRTRIFIIVSLAVLIVLGVSLLLVAMSKRRQAAAPAPAAATDYEVIDQSDFGAAGLPRGTMAAPLMGGLPVRRQTSEEAIRNSVRQLAKIFMERYGTYSTDSNFQNIRELEGLATPELWNKLKAKIGAPPPADAEFRGATTIVISSELTDWQADKAEVALRTRRVEQKGAQISTLYQEARVYLLKSGDKWLVEGFK